MPTPSPDLLVLGGGVAGLSAAVRAARAGLHCTVLTKAELSSTATQYAQGGVAAAWDDDHDSPDLHQTDTLVAGADLCDPDAVHILVTEGPQRVRDLMEMGAHFDRVDSGYALTREGGHSVPRVLHAGGDATGAEIQRALAVETSRGSVEVREGIFALDLLVERGRAVGVLTRDPWGTLLEFRARHTVLATGGAGQCFAVTTNPSVSTGDGIAMALRAGVAVADVEFMQFHPTALHTPASPRPLISEALRGEGAVLRDDDDVAFMVGEHPLGDLAPRDVVARAITRRLNATGRPHVWLDATAIPDFSHRFPTIWRSCRAVGLDPSIDFLPVSPAAHYLSGGVVTDLDGATSLPGLWACGEAACSGVHGANRLASNSLLDGLVFGTRLVEAIRAGKDAPESTGVMRGIPAYTGELQRRSEPALPRVGERALLQRLMTRGAGVLRDAESLSQVGEELAMMVPDDAEVDNLRSVARALVDAALAREESRGTHTRVDFPETRDSLSGRFVFCGGLEPDFVPLPRAIATRGRAG